MMAQRLAAGNSGIEVIISSTAKRAVGIAEPIALTLDIPLLEDPELYTFSANTLLGKLLKLPNYYHSVAIVGHNPAISDAACELLADTTDKAFATELPGLHLPTSAIVGIDANIHQWNKLSKSDCRISYIDYPKKPSQQQG